MEDRQPDSLPETLLKRVPEASYLNSDNTHRYRPIMRHFYQEHVAHRFELGAEELVQAVRVYDPGYTLIQCEQDLRQLVEWGNLQSEQERARARSIEEFLRKRLLYRLTEYGIAFERFLVSLEAETGKGGSLDPTRLEVLWSGLLQLQEVQEGDGEHGGKRARALWRQVWVAFEDTVHGALDFLGQMRIDDTLGEGLEAFLAYKDALVGYLQSFVAGLMDVAVRVDDLLRRWQEERVEERLLALIVAVESREPGPDGRLPDPAAVERRYREQWQSLVNWFQRDGGVKNLRRKATERIEAVVRQASRLVASRRTVLSRKTDLAELAVRFAHIARLEEAEYLADLRFGLGELIHLQGERSLDEPPAAWSAPRTLVLRPIQRGARIRTASAPVEAQEEARAAALLRYRQRQREEREMWDRLFPGGLMDLHRLRVEPEMLGRVLDLLGKVLVSPDGQAQASDGSRVRLLERLPTDTGRVEAGVGVLHLPAYRLRRSVGEGGSGR